MNCPFCNKPLWQTGRQFVEDGNNINYYACWNKECLADKDFPGYKCSQSQENILDTEEYAIASFYVKVDAKSNTSKIYKLVSCVLLDEIQIPRALWLNPKNFDETLDKLKFCVIFS